MGADKTQGECMRRIVLVFPHESDYGASEAHGFITKLGMDRMRFLNGLLSQVVIGGFGKMKIFAEKMNRSNKSAEFFASLYKNKDGEVELFCGDCDEIRTMHDLFALEYETLVFFDLVGSKPLLAEYLRVMEEWRIKARQISTQRYQRGVIAAIVVDLEKGSEYHILFDGPGNKSLTAA